MNNITTQKYGKLLKKDNTVKYAPISLKIDGITFLNPSKELYLKDGWKEIVDNPPSKRGYNAIAKGWAEKTDTIERVYELVRNAPIPKRKVFRYSKMRCIEELMRIDRWDVVKSWIEENGLMDLFLAAQEFSSDNQRFIEGKKVLVEMLGISRKDLENMLSRCIIRE